jgi:hypothetical protein
MLDMDNLTGRVLDEVEMDGYAWLWRSAYKVTLWREGVYLYMRRYQW